MKLFQKLLITPAVLGLLTPLAGSANEINLADVSNYSSSQVRSISEFDSPKELAIQNESLDILEAQTNNFEAGSFSETTTMTGSASFQLGAVTESEITEAVTATYSYDLDLNTSFTGEDNLYVGIESGNGAFGDIDFVTDNSQGGGDALSITSMYYQFPLGGFEVAVGPILDNDDLMPTTVTKYSDKFFMAGNPLTGSDFYAAPGITGSGVAIARNFDNGFNTSLSVIGLTADTTDGFLTDEGSDAFTLSAGYDGDNYGLGIIFTDNDNLCGAVAGFQTCDELGVPELDANTTTIGGYFTPNDGKTTLSATYGIASASVGEETIDDINDLHFGIDHELGNGVLSAAIKSSDFWDEEDDKDDLGEFGEIYYTYDINDSTELTAGISFAMPDEEGVTWLNRTAFGGEVTFKF